MNLPEKADNPSKDVDSDLFYGVLVFLRLMLVFELVEQGYFCPVVHAEVHHGPVLFGCACSSRDSYQSYPRAPT